VTAGSELAGCHDLLNSTLLRDKKGATMPTTKHELLDWLIDVPEDAEIGTDGAGLALLAILGTNVHLLEVGRIPNADELYAEAINQAIMERLRRIHAAGGETETGVIIVTFQGYVSGIPSLFSTDFNAAFIFKDKEQAEAFIAEFTDELHNPQILDCP
jgi:hypothetical protein